LPEEPVLVAEGLHKRYGPVQALAGFDLSVAAGEVAGLIGRNGAGKSTFAAVAAGLRRPDRGTVRVDGIDLAREPRRAKRRLGLAGQDIALYPTATVAENLGFFGRLHGLRGRPLHAAIDEVTGALRLTGLLRTTVATVSGGQRRRVHAAVALLHRPAVLLLDEPTAGADPASREALLAAVRERAAAGAAVCYTTHYLPELDILGATVALADAGRVVLRGSRADLLAGGVATLDELFRRWSADVA
jgi:ABC-2 type transport system ATP-binding protein